MGRRPVRRAAPPSDGAVGGVTGIPSPSPSSAAATSEGKVPDAAAGAPAAAAAAVPKGETGDKNPLMGLVHYGSDSEEEEPPAQPASASSLSTPDPSPAAGVTYTLPAGWQQCKDDAGLVYFWNTETGDTSWDPPEGTETMVSKATSAVDTPSEAPPIVPEAVADAASTAGGEAQAGSDATSDTASEPEEDKPVAAPETAVDEGASRASTHESGVTFAAVSKVGVEVEEVEEGAVSDGVCAGREVADRGATPKRSPPRSTKDQAVAQDRRTTAVGEEEGGEELPRQSKSAGTTSSDAPVPATTGIDDLLAGIEAELLLGGEDGDGNLDGDKDAAKGSTVEENGDARAMGDQEDFAPLRKVVPGLDTRAQEAHAELAALLAVAAQGKGGETGSSVEATNPLVRLGIELAAVLRARLSDWRQGKCMDSAEAGWGVGLGRRVKVLLGHSRKYFSSAADYRILTTSPFENALHSYAPCSLIDGAY